MAEKTTDCSPDAPPTSQDDVLAAMAQVQRNLAQFRQSRQEHEEEVRALELRRTELAGMGERLVAFGRHLERRKRRLAALREGRPPSERVQVKRAQTRLPHLHTVAWVSLALSGILAMSVVLVDRVMSIPGIATVGLRAVDRDGTTVRFTHDGAFMAWHEALPGDPAFVKAVAARLASRGLAPEGGIDQVAAILAQDLVVEHAGGDHIALVLGGEDITRTMATLDVIAMAFAGESARQAPRREEAWHATLAEDRSPANGPMASAVPAGLEATFVVRLIGVAVVLSGCVVGLAFGARFVVNQAKRVQIASENNIPEV